jgi:putative membrane protein
MTNPSNEERRPSGGSASDHLANERTFLAWIRTGVGIMAFGFVVVKFTLFVKQLSLALQRPLPVPSHGYSTGIGIFLVAFGGVLNLMSFLRYRITRKQLQDSDYKPENWMVTALVVFILLAGVALVWYLISSTRD